jgi:hypothetical protein
VVKIILTNVKVFKTNLIMFDFVTLIHRKINPTAPKNSNITNNNNDILSDFSFEQIAIPSEPVNKSVIIGINSLLDF